MQLYDARYIRFVLLKVNQHGGDRLLFREQGELKVKNENMGMKNLQNPKISNRNRFTNLN